MSSVNPTIGKVKCPISGDWAEVRKDRKGKYYYVGSAGMIKPNLPIGQEWLLNNALMYGKKEVDLINEKAPVNGLRVKQEEKDKGWSLL